MLTSSLLNEFKRCGEDLFRQGINNSHSGNMSVCDGATICITKSGSQLGRITWDSLVETSLHYVDAAARQASVELVVHRAIYQQTSAKAIVHAHPPHAVAISFMTDEIVPVDAEGQYYMPEVPVLVVDEAISSEEVAAKLPSLLRKNPIVVIRGHGSFAIGANIERCLLLTSSLENACKVKLLSDQAMGGVGR